MGFYSAGRRSGCHTLVVIDVTTVEVRIILYYVTYKNTVSIIRIQ
jgi:hypothetical protein